MRHPSREQTDHSMPLDLRALAYFFSEKARLIGALTATVLLAGIVFMLRSERVYRATTTIEVEEQQRSLVRGDGTKFEGHDGEALLKTIEQNFESSALRLRLGSNEELLRDPAFLPDLPRPASDIRLELAIGGKLSASIRSGTRLIDITAEDTNPDVAQKLARIAVEEFIGSMSEKRVQISQSAHGFLHQEAERLKGVLEKSAGTLQRYKEQNRAVSLDEKQDIVGQRLKELNQNVTNARAERLKIEADRAQITQLTGQPAERLLLLPRIANASEVIEALHVLNESTAEIATLSRRYKPEHPKYIEAVSARDELEKRRDYVIQHASELVGTALEAAIVTEKKLEDALSGEESIGLELGQMAIPYNALAREVESDRALYASLLARLKESEVGQSVLPYAIRIAAPASRPQRPIKPNKPLVLLLSLCGGLALGISSALAVHVMDRSLRTIDQAEEALGLPSLAAVPLQSGAELMTVRRLFIEKPHSAVAEAFRGLRTTLMVTGRGAGCRSVLFASSIPGEGKSFCAINYALALAGQGFRTLLVDSDLRLPSIGPAFLGAGTAAVGLTEILRDERTIVEAVHHTDIENLFILPAGRAVSKPTELIGKADVAGFLRNALVRFDRIVIDTAPVLAVSETLFLVPHVDVVCLVVRSGSTPLPAIARALDKLRGSGAKVPGFILNGLPLRGGYHYHYQAPDYGSDAVYSATGIEPRAARKD